MLRQTRVKKESPNMGTKTSLTSLSIINPPFPVKKESPNMGTKTSSYAYPHSVISSIR